MVRAFARIEPPVFEKRGDEIYNTASIINPQGDVVTRYSKMFPFYPYEVGVTPGDAFCVFDVPDVGRFGISICYDMGAEVILHPTMTGTIDRDSELAIARAMATVNQCYLFDVNGLETGGSGRSIVCGPDGRVIYQAEGNEEIIPIELNMERVQRSRELGVLRLGQPLKSFRDHIGQFSIYQPGAKLPYLDSLGPLIKPKKLAVLHELKQREDALAFPKPPTNTK